MLTGDLKNKDREDKDWYSMMPDSFPVFIFGKPAEERFDGKVLFTFRVFLLQIINIGSVLCCATGFKLSCVYPYQRPPLIVIVLIYCTRQDERLS